MTKKAIKNKSRIELSRIKENMATVKIVESDKEQIKRTWFQKLFRIDKPRVKKIERKKGVLWNPFKRGKNIINFGMGDNYRLKKKPEKCYIIEMLFANGTKKQFVLESAEQTFTLNSNNKTYFLYYEECYFDISLNQYCLIYHENYCEPLNREIQVDNKESPYFNISPDNLKDFIGMKYLKAITENSDSELNDFFKKYWLYILGAVLVLMYYLNQGAGG